MRPASPRVLVLSMSELANDARVLRQIGFLAPRFAVTVAAFGRCSDLPPGVEFIELSQLRPSGLGARAEAAGRIALRIAGRYRPAYWLDRRTRGWRAALGATLPFEAIVVNDLAGLPLARALPGDSPIVFDAHEHWTSESASWTGFQRLSMRGAHEWIVDRHVPQTATMMTVSPGIARDFERRAGVRASIVTNAPSFHDLRPSEVSEPIRLVHVGVADERRRIEGMIEAVALLDERFTLDLVLARDNDYRRRLSRLAELTPGVRVLGAVPSAELVRFQSGYDIGVYLFPAHQPNQIYSLPNKFFDYIQARLAVAIGPSPEMAAIVREWDCGVVSKSFSPDAFAETLRALTVAEVQRLKSNADRAAHVLNSERNRDVVVSLVQRAIAGHPTGSGAPPSSN